MMSSLSLIYYVSILLTKTSICLLYLRIFGVLPTFRRFVLGGLAFAIIYHAALFGLAIAHVVRCDSSNTLHAPLCEDT